MQQTKKFKMADAISPYLAVSCGLSMMISRARCGKEFKHYDLILDKYPPPAAMNNCHWQCLIQDELYGSIKLERDISKSTRSAPF